MDAVLISIPKYRTKI